MEYQDSPETLDKLVVPVSVDTPDPRDLTVRRDQKETRDSLDPLDPLVTKEILVLLE